MAVRLLPVVTPRMLASLRLRPDLPPDSWYFIAATALSILNQPDAIPIVYRHALDHCSGTDNSNRQAISRRIRAALIKSVAIGGLPKTINSLLALKAATPPHPLDVVGPDSPNDRAAHLLDTQGSVIMRRGREHFDKTYGKVTERVMSQLDNSGTEELGLIARLMYGYVLSDTVTLTSAEISFVLIAGLIPQDVNPQLKGHLRGALNHGASVEQVAAVRDVVIDICNACGMKRFTPDQSGGWGWREDVATLNLK